MYTYHSYSPNVIIRWFFRSLVCHKAKWNHFKRSKIISNLQFFIILKNHRNFFTDFALFEIMLLHRKKLMYCGKIREKLIKTNFKVIQKRVPGCFAPVSIYLVHGSKDNEAFVTVTVTRWPIFSECRKYCVFFRRENLHVLYLVKHEPLNYPRSGSRKIRHMILPR